MTEIEYQRWKQIRAKGFTHYLLVRGILYRGAPIGLTMAIMEIIWPSPGYHHQALRFIIRCVGCGVTFGLVYGYGSWKDHESTFKRHKSDDDHVA